MIWELETREKAISRTASTPTYQLGKNTAQVSKVLILFSSQNVFGVTSDMTSLNRLIPQASEEKAERSLASQ